MWIVAGILFGIVVGSLFAGFHIGPHAQVATGLFGGLLAAWLVLMAADGATAALLWPLFGVDVAMSAGAGALAWQGLHARSGPGLIRPLEGAEGVAMTDLEPEGIARVRGEQWSAVSVNGRVRAGTRVQVLRTEGLRLQVWGEDPDVLPIGWSPGDEQPSSTSGQPRQIGEQEP